MVSVNKRGGVWCFLGGATIHRETDSHKRSRSGIVCRMDGWRLTHNVTLIEGRFSNHGHFRKGDNIIETYRMATNTGIAYAKG